MGKKNFTILFVFFEIIAIFLFIFLSGAWYCPPRNCRAPILSAAHTTATGDRSIPPLGAVAKTNQPDWLDKLIEKIRFVESSNRSIVPDGDNGLAGGPLQLHPGVVDEVNRNCETKFTYTDRYDLDKARQIARLYITYWLDAQKEEIAARIFNGGPRGWRKEATNNYWEKIQNRE